VKNTYSLGRTLLLLTLLLGGRLITQGQNVGIGTTTPGSRLTVNGSFAAGYTAVNTAAYAVLDNDYYLVWSGAAAGTFTLPTPTATTKGRVYKIRNNTALFGLTLTPGGGVLIDGQASLSLPAGSAVELIANGNTTGTAWEVVSLASASATSADAGASSGTIGGAGGACSPAPTATGTFVVGNAATTQTLAVTVTVTTPGTYTIGTSVVNGLSFFAAGYFATTGVQTVALYAHGTPTAAGSFTHTVAYGNSRCTTSVTTVPVATFNCAGGTQTQSPAGALTSGTAYSGTYTVSYSAGSGVNYPAASQTINGLTLARPAGTYAAGGGNVVYTLSGTYTGPANGTVEFTITECGTTITYGDAIRGALAAAGCASCAAYDAAAVGSWVLVTAAEYAALANTANVSGASKYGSTDARVNTTPASYSWTANNTVGHIAAAPSFANVYVVAAKLNMSGAVSGIQLKAGATSNSGFNAYAASFATSAAGLSHLVLKRPTATTGTNAYIGIYTGSSGGLGLVNGGGTVPFGSGNTSTLNINSNGEPLLQVIGTTTKQW